MPTQTKTFSVTIRAPQEEVFAYVSDLTRHPEWSGGLLRVEARTAGQVGVGSKYVSHGELLNEKERKNELQVTQFHPPNVFAFMAKDPGVGEVQHTFTFESRGGETRMERKVSTSLPAVKAFLFRLMIDPLVGNPMMRKSMARLKDKLEGKTSE